MGRTVKEMLEAKLAENRKKNQPESSPNKPDEDPIQIPFYLSKVANILPVAATEDNRYSDPSYHCSTMSRVWFRDHSNIEEILSEHLNMIPSPRTHPKEAYMSVCIRSVTSAPLRKLQHPYRNFSFSNLTDELIGRELLINPRIRSKPDLSAFLVLQNRYQIKLCGIALDTNNLVHVDAKNFLEEHRKKAGSPPDIPPFSRRFLDNFILRKYYERENLIEYFHLNTLSLEEIEKVTNFEYIARKDMQARKLPEHEYQKFATGFLEIFKKDRCYRKLFDHFQVNPKYVLICNILSDDQQQEIADDIDKFFEYTNAGRTFNRLRDGSTREEFHELYRSRNHESRKLPPFHNLYYKLKESKSISGLSTTNSSRFVRERFVKNSDPVAIAVDLDEGSDTSRDTVLVRPSGSKTTVVSNQQSQHEPEKTNCLPMITSIRDKSSQLEVSSSKRTNSSFPIASSEVSQALQSSQFTVEPLSLPSKYLIDPKLSLEALNLVKILSSDPRFVRHAKLQLGQSYKMNFEELWKKNKRFILMNFVNGFCESGVEELENVVRRCGADVQKKAMQIIEMKTKKNRAQTTIAPEAISETPDFSPDVVQVTPGEVPAASVIVKLEKLSPTTPYTESSEVQCLGSLVEQAIVINDSQDAETSLLVSLQAEEDARNPFLREINENSQKDASTNCPPNYVSRATRNARLELQLKGVNNKRPSPTAPPGPKSKKRATRSNSKPSALEYIDEFSSSPTGNPSQLQPCSEVLNDDFSVFLSSQLPINREIIENALDAPSTSTSTPFTFAGSCQNHNTTNTNETNSASNSACFIVDLKRVVYEKDKKFELYVNLCQFNLHYAVVVNQSIKDLLNLKDDEFEAIRSLLEILGKYDYTIGEARKHPSGDFISRQLDLFFSSQIKFRTFQIQISDGGYIQCYDSKCNEIVTEDLSNAIALDTLKNLKSVNLKR